MTLAHIGGVPVEELAQPLLIALMLSGAWLGARLRRPQRSRPDDADQDVNLPPNRGSRGFRHGVGPAPDPGKGAHARAH